MVEVGKYNVLKVLKHVDFGYYLDGGDDEEILLPKRFVPEGLQEDDELEVFIYHDNEGKLIATTQKANGAVGDVVELEVVSMTQHGAFLDWGIMKDVFLPLSQQRSRIYEGEKYLVLLFIDKVTGRVTATEKLGRAINNDVITINEGDEVSMRIYHQTDIGLLLEFFLIILKFFSIISENVFGLLNSIACAAYINSIAKIFSIFPRI